MERIQERLGNIHKCDLKENKKGITLVALVITIVILLILAGISISALTNTGLFGKAKEAKKASENAEKEQSQTLSEYEKELNKYVAKELTDDKINKVLSKTENTVLKDANSNVFTLPAGFKVVVSDDTNNAKTVDKGIVIEDETDAATKGSQFVWIPVGNIVKSNGTKITINLNRYIFADDDNGTPTEQNENVIENYYQELTLSDKGNTVAKSIDKFKTSVTTNGGYYIGRYEARTITKRNDKENALTQITEKGTDQVYNYVTQQQATQQSQEMYTNNNFTSDLTNSYAWDTAILFLQNCGTNKKYSKQNRENNTSLSQIGTTNDKQCNVYDMAGNIREWTTETSSKPGNPCVNRGGSYNYDEGNCASSHDDYYISFSDIVIGFRPILYINI